MYLCQNAVCGSQNKITGIRRELGKAAMLSTNASQNMPLAQWGSLRWYCLPYGQSLKQGRGVFKETRQQPEAGLSPQGSAAVWAEEAKLLLAEERQTYQLLSCNPFSNTHTNTHTPVLSMYGSESH